MVGGGWGGGGGQLRRDPHIGMDLGTVTLWTCTGTDDEERGEVAALSDLSIAEIDNEEEDKGGRAT